MWRARLAVQSRTSSRAHSSSQTRRAILQWATATHMDASTAAGQSLHHSRCLPTAAAYTTLSHPSSHRTLHSTTSTNRALFHACNCCCRPFSTTESPATTSADQTQSQTEAIETEADEDTPTSTDSNSAAGAPSVDSVTPSQSSSDSTPNDLTSSAADSASNSVKAEVDDESEAKNEDDDENDVEDEDEPEAVAPAAPLSIQMEELTVQSEIFAHDHDRVAPNPLAAVLRDTAADLTKTSDGEMKDDAEEVDEAEAAAADDDVAESTEKESKETEEVDEDSSEKDADPSIRKDRVSQELIMARHALWLSIKRLYRKEQYYQLIQEFESKLHSMDEIFEGFACHHSEVLLPYLESAVKLNQYHKVLDMWPIFYATFLRNTRAIDLLLQACIREPDLANVNQIYAHLRLTDFLFIGKKRKDPALAPSSDAQKGAAQKGLTMAPPAILPNDEDRPLSENVVNQIIKAYLMKERFTEAYQVWQVVFNGRKLPIDSRFLLPSYLKNKANARRCVDIGEKALFRFCKYRLHAQSAYGIANHLLNDHAYDQEEAIRMRTTNSHRMWIMYPKPSYHFHLSHAFQIYLRTSFIEALPDTSLLLRIFNAALRSALKPRWLKKTSTPETKQMHRTIVKGNQWLVVQIYKFILHHNEGILRQEMRDKEQRDEMESEETSPILEPNSPSALTENDSPWTHMSHRSYIKLNWKHHYKPLIHLCMQVHREQIKNEDRMKAKAAANAASPGAMNPTSESPPAAASQTKATKKEFDALLILNTILFDIRMTYSDYSHVLDSRGAPISQTSRVELEKLQEIETLEQEHLDSARAYEATLPGSAFAIKYFVPLNILRVLDEETFLELARFWLQLGDFSRVLNLAASVPALNKFNDLQLKLASICFTHLTNSGMKIQGKNLYPLVTSQLSDLYKIHQLKKGARAWKKETSLIESAIRRTASQPVDGASSYTSLKFLPTPYLFNKQLNWVALERDVEIHRKLSFLLALLSRSGENSHIMLCTSLFAELYPKWKVEPNVVDVQSVVDSAAQAKTMKTELKFAFMTDLSTLVKEDPKLSTTAPLDVFKQLINALTEFAADKSIWLHLQDATFMKELPFACEYYNVYRAGKSLDHLYTIFRERFVKPLLSENVTVDSVDREQLLDVIQIQRGYISWYTQMVGRLSMKLSIVQDHLAFLTKFKSVPDVAHKIRIENQEPVDLSEEHFRNFVLVAEKDCFVATPVSNDQVQLYNAYRKQQRRKPTEDAKTGKDVKSSAAEGASESAVVKRIASGSDMQDESEVSLIPTGEDSSETKSNTVSTPTVVRAVRSDVAAKRRAALDAAAAARRAAKAAATAAAAANIAAQAASSLARAKANARVQQPKHKQQQQQQHKQPQPQSKPKHQQLQSNSPRSPTHKQKPKSENGLSSVHPLFGLVPEKEAIKRIKPKLHGSTSTMSSDDIAAKIQKEVKKPQQPQRKPQPQRKTQDATPQQQPATTVSTEAPASGNANE